jgi:hypothetical protein
MKSNFKDLDIAEIFDGYPEGIKDNLLFLRNLIFEVASETD